MKTVIIAACMLLAFTAKDRLTGRWESKPSDNGNITGVVFKEDNSFEGYINRKPFVSGTYTLQDSIFSFTDNGCMNQEGVYKIIFFHDKDSLRFKNISDNCTERRTGMERLVMGRVK